MNPYQKRDLYKFIVYQTKMLVSDAQGDPVYMSSFDKIMYEFYGVKHFSKKMSEMWDDREFAQLINKIGIDRLLTLMKNTRYCNILRDLVRIDDDVESLKKKMRKMKARGEMKKGLIKEYRYLVKLYNNGTKSLRKRLGIKSARTAYKRQFKAVKGLINDYGYDDEYGRWGGFDSFGGMGRSDYDPYDQRDPVYDDDDGYYDDDYEYGNRYEDSSELQDFVEMLNGNRRRSNRPGANRRRVQRPIEDYDEYEDDDDDFDEYGEYHRNQDFKRSSDNFYPTDLEDKVNYLVSKMTEHDDAINGLTAQAEYDYVNHRDPVTHKPRKQPIDYDEFMKAQAAREQAEAQMSNSSDPSLASVLAEVKMISGAVANLTKAMTGFNEWRMEIDSLLSEIDDEDDMEVSMEKPNMSMEDQYDEAARMYWNAMNQTPDVYTTPMEELPEDDGKSIDTMSREEVIDEINNGKPMEVDAQVEIEQPSEPVQTKVQRPGGKKQ